MLSSLQSLSSLIQNITNISAVSIRFLSKCLEVQLNHSIKLEVHLPAKADELLEVGVLEELDEEVLQSYVCPISWPSSYPLGPSPPVSSRHECISVLAESSLLYLSILRQKGAIHLQIIII